MHQDYNPIRLRRIEKGLTQGALAAAAGVSQQMLSKLETGDRTLRFDTPDRFAFVQRLAAILGCRPAEIVPQLALSPQPDVATQDEMQLLVSYRAMPDDRRRILISIATLMAAA